MVAPLLPAPKKSEVGKAVRFRSSATESTDSGSEDIYRAPPNRVSVSDSNEDNKVSHCSTSDEGASAASSICGEGEGGAGLVSLDAIPKLTHHGSLSSDDNDLEEASTSQVRRGKKSSRQKWVPLDIPPETSQGKKKKQGRSFSEADAVKREKQTKGGEAASSNTNVPQGELEVVV